MRAPAGTLQARYLPEFGCFGCGPTNDRGLQLMCRAEGDEVVADWAAAPHHQGPPGVMHGGLIGALFDCHGAWTACHDAAQRRGTDEFVPMVTAEFTVRLRRPTPLDVPLQLRGRVVDRDGRRVAVESSLHAGDAVTATYRGSYVEVAPYAGVR